MSSSGARRTRWVVLGNISLRFGFAAFILLGGIILPATGVLAASERQAILDPTTLIELVAVVVEQRDGALTVRLQTSRTPKYSVTSLGAPERIIIDLEGAHHAWRGSLTSNPEPIREVRGSQWKPGT